MDSDYLEFEKYIKGEILKAERKAIASIHTKNIDEESANRAKFYQEVIDLVRTKIKTKDMNKKKTPI